MREGNVVQVVKRVYTGQYLVERGVRGRVLRTHDDWARVELPDGRRFETHKDDLAVILKTDVDI